MSLSSGLAAAGSVIQGVASIQQGNAEAVAARTEAKTRSDELKRDSEMTKIAAEQSQSSALDDLARTIGTIRATVGGRNLDPNSPSGMALEGAAQGYAYRDIGRNNFNAQQQIGANDLAGRTAIAMGSFKGKVMRNAGYMGGASSFLKAAGQAASGMPDSGGKK